MNISNYKNKYLAPRRIDFFNEISKELDHAMNNIFSGDFFEGVSKKGRGYPLLDAIRTEDKLIIQYTVPGVKLEDLSVEITEDENGNFLTVSGYLSETYVAKDSDYQIRELSSQNFKRSIRLPEDIDVKNNMSKLKNGILVVEFACKASQPISHKTQKIKISSE